MKNLHGKRKRKGKNCKNHAKETSANASGINSLAELKVKDIKSDRVSQFNFFSEDHYSFYERTSVRREARKGLGCKGSESTMENEGLQTISSETKGQQKSGLPPLKDLARSQQRKQMTRNAFGQSKLDTKPQDDGNRGKENIVSTSSEKSKTLASVSFVGIYDLDDMNNTPKNRSDGVLNLEREQKVQGESNKEKPSEQVENTLGYVIQNLTLEGKSYLSKKNSLQNKLILPGIKENKKFIDDKFKTFKRRDTLYREREKKHRLPKLVPSDQRTPRMVESFPKRMLSNRRGKKRTHHNSFEQVYLEREIPRLPLILNGRVTQF